MVATAWSLFYNASRAQPSLYDNPAFAYDFVDLTRQYLANTFITLYTNFTTIYATTRNATTLNSTTPTNATTASIRAAGAPLLTLLSSLDSILATNPNFLLSTWLDSALTWTNSTATFPALSTSGIPFATPNTTSPLPNYTTENSTGPAVAAYYEYSARNQITLWGPTGQISDYASKSWAGLVSGYYLPRWQMFVEYCATTPYARYNYTALNAQTLVFEQAWQTQRWGTVRGENGGTTELLAEVLGVVVRQWAGTGVFGV